MKKQLKLKPKVEKNLIKMSLILEFIGSCFVEEKPLIAGIILLICIVPCYLIFMYGSEIV